MFRFFVRTFALALSLALIVVACSSPTTPSTSITTTTTTTTTTTSTTTTSATETYNGSLASGGTNYHVFHTAPGVMTVTLVSLNPATLYPPVGFGLGMWDGSSCTLVLSSASTVPGTVFTATASIETDVCVKVWDPTPFDPSLTVGYQVTATHFAFKTS